jgi:hypothetical protein
LGGVAFPSTNPEKGLSMNDSDVHDAEHPTDPVADPPADEAAAPEAEAEAAEAEAEDEAEAEGDEAE